MKWIILTILLSPIAIVGGCTALCKLDVSGKANEIRKHNTDGIISSMIPGNYQPNRIFIPSGSLPNEIASLSPSMVVADKRGYVTVYFVGFFTWRGIVIKLSATNPTGINVCGNEFHNNVATYVGHHVP